MLVGTVLAKGAAGYRYVFSASGGGDSEDGMGGARFDSHTTIDNSVTKFRYANAESCSGNAWDWDGRLELKVNGQYLGDWRDGYGDYGHSGWYDFHPVVSPHLIYLGDCDTITVDMYGSGSPAGSPGGGSVSLCATVVFYK